MMKKYELTEETIRVRDHTLHRIKAVISFSNVGEGDLGGFIEHEDNLTHSKACWVYNQARVFGNAQICDNVRVFGDAKIYGNANIKTNAYIVRSQKYITIGPIGSRNDYITFYKTNDSNIMVTTGCFCGTIEKFETIVTKTHKDSKVGTDYFSLINFIKEKFELK